MGRTARTEGRLPPVTPPRLRGSGPGPGAPGRAPPPVPRLPEAWRRASDSTPGLESRARSRAPRREAPRRLKRPSSWTDLHFEVLSVQFCFLPRETPDADEGGGRRGSASGSRAPRQRLRSPPSPARSGRSPAPRPEVEGDRREVVDLRERPRVDGQVDRLDVAAAGLARLDPDGGVRPRPGMTGSFAGSSSPQDGQRIRLKSHSVAAETAAESQRAAPCDSGSPRRKRRSAAPPQKGQWPSRWRRSGAMPEARRASRRTDAERRARDSRRPTSRSPSH